MYHWNSKPIKIFLFFLLWILQTWVLLLVASYDGKLVIGNKAYNTWDSKQTSTNEELDIKTSKDALNLSI
jgi:hypothetical protein